MQVIQRAGLIGQPLAHSWSPAMQNAAFVAAGISAQYTLWETEPAHLAVRIASLRAPDVLGANVTIPYKAAVVPLLDAITTGARETGGAVNTIAREETASGIRLIGHNTDVPALQRVLREQQAWSSGSGEKRLLVLGAGGAARAAISVALREGADPWIAARNPTVGQSVLATVQQHRMPDNNVIDLLDTEALGVALAKTQVLVNATPIGTRDPTAAPIPLALLGQLPQGAVVCDMVYNPPETALVRAARAYGLRACGGMLMLLYQGAEAFSLWTGRPAPLAAMRAALERQAQAAATGDDIRKRRDSDTTD